MKMFVHNRCFPDEALFNRHLGDVLSGNRSFMMTLTKILNHHLLLNFSVVKCNMFVYCIFEGSMSKKGPWCVLSIALYLRVHRKRVIIELRVSQSSTLFECNCHNCGNFVSGWVASSCQRDSVYTGEPCLLISLNWFQQLTRVMLIYYA